MGMILADNLAHRPGTLFVRLGGKHAGVQHGVEDTAVHRLQAVAHIRQGAGHDDRHGILDEACLHLTGKIDGFQGSPVNVGKVQAGAALIGQKAGGGVANGIELHPHLIAVFFHGEIIVNIVVRVRAILEIVELDVVVGAYRTLAHLVVLKEIAFVDAGVQLVVKPAIAGSFVICHRSNLSV